ncbi:MAG: hypothetical protein IPI58_00435 [Alphaproteobacteria bacterium]|nr:MAG: hypothetical protein IPI58_00435 [Alphaproteobacteria bacterium]
MYNVRDLFKRTAQSVSTKRTSAAYRLAAILMPISLLVGCGGMQTYKTDEYSLSGERMTDTQKKAMSDRAGVPSWWSAGVAWETRGEAKVREDDRRAARHPECTDYSSPAEQLALGRLYSPDILTEVGTAPGGGLIAYINVCYPPVQRMAGYNIPGLTPSYDIKVIGTISGSNGGRIYQCDLLLRNSDRADRLRGSSGLAAFGVNATALCGDGKERPMIITPNNGGGIYGSGWGVDYPPRPNDYRYPPTAPRYSEQPKP